MIGLSASAEEEIAQLADKDKAEFLEMAGVTETWFNKLIHCRSILTLRLPLTAGRRKHAHGTFKAGMKAIG